MTMNKFQSKKMIKPIKGYLRKEGPPRAGQSFAEDVMGIGILRTNLDKFKQNVDDSLNTRIIQVKEVIDEVKQTTSEGVQKIEAAVENATTVIEETKQEALAIINEVKIGPKGEPGTDGKTPDEKKIVETVLAQVPKPEKIDEDKLLKKFIAKIPENKASLKIIQEKFEIDPMSVIEKILAMPSEKFKLKSDNIDGLEQTLSAFRNQIANRGYLHGGGDTVVAGSNIVITTNANGTKTIAATGGGTGTVSSVSVVSANGFAGTVANPTTTPAITLSTTLSQASIPFVGATSNFTQDNANFNYVTSTRTLNIDSIGTGTSLHTGPTAGTSNAMVGGAGIEFIGTNNTLGGVNLILNNTNSGTAAFSDLYLQNDLSVSGGGLTHFAVINYTSSTYSDTTYGTINAFANQLSVYGTDGPTTIGTTKVGSYVNFFVGGANIANEIGRFNTAGLTVGLAGTTLGVISFSGNTSGTTLLQPLAAASGTLTLPSATDTVAVLAASQAFTNKTYNGLTITSTTGTFTLTNAKTLAVQNTLTLAGTDSTTMTFPTTSATIARTDAANNFVGNQTMSTYLRVGSNSAPVNTTAGDLTATRLNLGNVAFNVSDSIFQASGTTTQTASQAVIWAGFTPTIAPTSNSASNFRTLQFQSLLASPTGVTITSVRAGYFENRDRQDGTIATSIALDANPFVVDSSSASTATATNVTGVASSIYGRPSGTTTSTITTGIGFDCVSFNGTGLTATTITGFRMVGPGTAGAITTLLGLDISSMNLGTTTNICVRLAQPNLVAGIGSTTDSIALRIPTASTSLGDQTATTTNVHGISIGVITYTSTTNTRTVTNMASMYIAGAPVASTNVTVSANGGPYALWVDANASRFDGNLDFSVSDSTDIVLGTTTGTRFGTAITQKIGFYNATPIVQRSGAAEAAVAATGSTNVTPFGYTTAAQADAIVTLVNEIRTTLVNLGLFKGSA